MTPDAQSPRGAPRSTFPFGPWLWPAFKWTLFLVVLAFVAIHAQTLWGELDSRSLRPRWGWLVLATIVSVAGWLPSVWYWRELLRAVGVRPDGGQLLKAYYCGHPGKYVPGKAMVILIRATILSQNGVPAPTTAYTVTLETLTFMAAGCVTMVLLLPWMIAALPQLAEQAEFIAQPACRVAFPLLAIIGGIGGLAALSRIAGRLAERMTGTLPAVGTPSWRIPVRTFASGLAVFLGAWWLQGATLGLTLQALSPEPVSWSDWPLWTGTAAVSLVGGFLAIFAPGGLGVREGLLMELLRHQVGPHEAVAAAIVLRGVTLVGELLMAAAVYLFIRAPGPQGGNPLE
jgi:uncharacterized membrane protein YbhN (UPF0104 family)